MPTRIVSKKLNGKSRINPPDFHCMRSSNRRFIFIGGLHRSGTSLLHRALRAHYSISGFIHTGAPEDEGQHLQTVFPPAAAYGGPGRFCFAEEAALNEISPLATLENREKLLREWERHLVTDKAFFIEKSPPNLIRMRFFQALFPNSLFINIIRHPLAVSYATQKWSKTSILELVDHWIIAHQKMLEHLPFIRHWRLIRYEDFVENPKAVLTDIYQWVGIEPVPFAERVEPDVNRKYFAQWETESAKKMAVSERLPWLHALPSRFGYHFAPPYTQARPVLS
jgi:hypothetical protein